MRTSALLFLIGVTAPLLGRSDDGPRPKFDATVAPTVVLGLSSGGASATQSPAVPSVTSVSGPLLYPGGDLYSLELTTPAGDRESFVFFRPTPAPAGDVPLLVHFHAANGAGAEVTFFTTFVEEASARGWFLIAPDQAVPGSNGYTYSMLEAQERMQAVIDWALAHHPIDRERVYAYGFSMGGGDVVNFASRHLDPARGAFAAIVNHTGTTCLPDEYERSLSPGQVRPILEGIFGGPPAAQPFPYLRSSAIELDPTTHMLNPTGEHLAVNLGHVPVWSWYGADDPNQQMIDQLHELDLLLASLGAQNPPIEVVPGASHTWELLDETGICDWFASQSLAVPSHGRLRIDSSGTYHHYDVAVEGSAAFASLSFDARSSDTFDLDATRNVGTVEVDVAGAGLATQTVPFNVSVATSDGRPDVLRLRGFGRTPGAVELDGVDVTATLVNSNWLYTPSTDTLVLAAPSGAGHRWTIR